jgi:hypothetical protein
MNTSVGLQDWQDAADESHRKAPLPKERNGYVKDLLEAAAKEVLDAKGRLGRCSGGGSGPIFSLSTRPESLRQKRSSTSGDRGKLQVYRPE